jgi:hypothetical protein
LVTTRSNIKHVIREGERRTLSTRKERSHSLYVNADSVSGRRNTWKNLKILRAKSVEYFAGIGIDILAVKSEMSRAFSIFPLAWGLQSRITREPFNDHQSEIGSEIGE